MCFPYCECSLSFKLPVHDPSVSIASQKAAVLAYESYAVYLRGMPAEDIAWLSGRQCGSLALNGHV
jgi:hypothetical protein